MSDIAKRHMTSGGMCATKRRSTTGTTKGIHTVINRSIVVLLTATIDPGRTTMVARNDPKLRLADYAIALRSWISVDPSLRIVFCENSGYDLGALMTLVGVHIDDRVEFISLKGNSGGDIRGKGFAELGTINHALATSRLIASSDAIVKCSGRIVVRNAVRVLRALASIDCDVICTLKQYLTFADSRVFCATPRFISDHLQPRQELIDDSKGVYFEHALACAVADAIAHGMRWRPFPIFPRIQGISGTFGTPMTDSAPIAAAKSVFNRLRDVVYGR